MVIMTIVKPDLLNVFKINKVQTEYKNKPVATQPKQNKNIVEKISVHQNQNKKIEKIIVAQQKDKKTENVITTQPSSNKETKKPLNTKKYNIESKNVLLNPEHDYTKPYIKYNIDKNGNKYISNRIEYDKNGNVTADIHYYRDGSIYYQELYEYYQDGTKKSHTSQVVNGGGTPNFIEYFDKNGKVIRTDYFDIRTGQKLYSK